MPSLKNTLKISQSGTIPHPAFRNPQLQGWVHDGLIQDTEAVTYNLPEFVADSPAYVVLLKVIVHAPATNDFDTCEVITDGTDIEVAGLHGSSQFGTTYQNNGTFNIDLSSGQIRFNNELGEPIYLTIARVL